MRALIIKYLEEASVTKAVLFLALVPLTIILLNTDFPKNGYIDAILDYVIMIIYSLIVG